MKLSVLGTIIRAVLPLSATVTAGAILLARINPDFAAYRTESATPYQVLDLPQVEMRAEVPRLLDVRSGRLEVLPRPHLWPLSRASVSPWEVGRRRQVVGCLPGTPASEATRLVRMTLPDGELLDQIDLSGDASLLGPPCWSPRGEARVLYAGGDGQIYGVNFEATGLDGKVVGATEARPRALAWRTPAAPGVEVFIHDLAWPADDRLGGRLLGSALVREEGGRRLDWQIWWLELGRDGTSIVAAGRLFPDPPSAGVEERRLPNLIRDEVGASALAYLTGPSDRREFELRVAPVRFEGSSRVPQARESEARVLARGCLLTTPAATPDGRWLTVVRRDGPLIRVERVAIGANPTGLAVPVGPESLAGRPRSGDPLGSPTAATGFGRRGG